MRWNW